MIENDTTQNASSETSRSSRSQYFAVMIANPTSGSYAQHAQELEENIAFLRQSGWNVELRLMEAAGDARRLAHEAVEQKADVVIAAGGDGTINEVIQKLAGSETALGVLPIGTVNVWAREMDIPLDSGGACEVLLHGTTRRVDLGRVNDHYFLLMVGIGFDGEVTQSVENKPLKRLGVLGYLLASIWVRFRFDGFRASLKIDEREVRTRAVQIVIGNTRLYGGAIKFTWQAKCDDGLLDVCIVHKGSTLSQMLMILDLLLQRERGRQRVSYETCESLELRTRRPIAMQIDGDPAGQTPATLSAVPDALKVIVPQKRPEGVFREDGETDDLEPV
jgi:YegS/Rv2252/BmrU family lipid kinase